MAPRSSPSHLLFQAFICDLCGKVAYRFWASTRMVKRDGIFLASDLFGKEGDHCGTSFILPTNKIRNGQGARIQKMLFLFKKSESCGRDASKSNPHYLILPVRGRCYPLSLWGQKGHEAKPGKPYTPELSRIQNCYATHCRASKKHLASILKRPEPNVSKIQKVRHLFRPCTRQDPLIQEDKKIQPTKAGA